MAQICSDLKGWSGQCHEYPGRAKPYLRIVRVRVSEEHVDISWSMWIEKHFEAIHETID